MRERRTQELRHEAISTNTPGTLALTSALAGQTSRIHYLILVASAVLTVRIDRGATSLTGNMTLDVGVPLVFEYSVEPHFVSAPGEVLNLVTVGAGQVSGMFGYIQSA